MAVVDAGQGELEVATALVSERALSRERGALIHRARGIGVGVSGGNTDGERLTRGGANSHGLVDRVREREVIGNRVRTVRAVDTVEQRPVEEDVTSVGRRFDSARVLCPSDVLQHRIADRYLVEIDLILTEGGGCRDGVTGPTGDLERRRQRDRAAFDVLT